MLTPVVRVKRNDLGILSKHKATSRKVNKEAENDHALTVSRIFWNHLKDSREFCSLAMNANVGSILGGKGNVRLAVVQFRVQFWGLEFLKKQLLVMKNTDVTFSAPLHFSSAHFESSHIALYFQNDCIPYIHSSFYLVRICWIPSIHDRLALEMNRCLQDVHVPEWMTKGKTTLIQKDPSKGTAPNNYRPITCLLMMWKILTAQIREKSTIR